MIPSMRLPESSKKEAASGQPMKLKQIRQMVADYANRMVAGELGGIPEATQRQLTSNYDNNVDRDVQRIASELSANYASLGGTFTGAHAGALAQNSQAGAQSKRDFRSQLTMQDLGMRNDTRRFGLDMLMGIDRDRRAGIEARRNRKMQGYAAIGEGLGGIGKAAASMYGAGMM